MNGKLREILKNEKRFSIFCPILIDFWFFFKNRYRNFAKLESLLKAVLAKGGKGTGTNSSGRVWNVYKKVMMEIIIRRTSILPFKKCFEEIFENLQKIMKG